MSEEMQLALEHTLKTMRELKEAKAEIERLQAALERINALDDQAECCGNGAYNHPGNPPECCNKPIYGLDRAKVIATAALAQGKPND